MAGGSRSSGSKVREWFRKRMAPRRKAAGAAVVVGDIGSEAAAVAAAAASAPSSPGRGLLAGALPSALRPRKPRGNVLVALFRRAVYDLLWLVESVVVVAQLVVFFVRFGFRL